MPGMFIDVKIDRAAAADPALARKLAEVCPVSIFDAAGDRLTVVEANLDECVLCDLCVAAAPPGAVTIVKLYES